MDNKTEHVLSKTAKGIDAARSGAGLSDAARAVLKLVDGRKNLSVLGTVVTATGISATDFQAAVQQLCDGGYVQKIEHVAEVKDNSIAAEVEKQMLVTLDFTTEYRDQRKKALGVSIAPQAQNVSAADEAERRQAEERARQAKAARLKLEADIRQKLAAALRPRIEEELRAKLRPKLEEELRPKLVAALRPGIEAEIRTQLQQELTPRVELELKARLARTMAIQLQNAESQTARSAVASDVPQQSDDPGGRNFERVLDSLSEPVFSLDKSGNCTSLNPAWTGFTGYSVDESAGRQFSGFFEEGDRRGLEKMLASVCDKTALRFDHQARLKRKEGDGLWVELKMAPLYSPQGDVEGVCGVLKDVTDTRRIARDMELAGVRLLLLIDQIDTGVLLEDQAGFIQQVNGAFCALLSVEAAPYSLEGLPTRELLQKIATAVVDREGFERRMTEIQEAGEDVKGETIMLVDGRMIEHDYLEVSSEDGAGGHLWLFREVRRNG